MTGDHSGMRPRLAFAMGSLLVVAGCAGAPPAAPTPDGGAATPPVDTATPSPTEQAVVTVRGLLPTGGRNISMFPQLLGEELGYYAEEGISIRWEGSDGSPFVVQQLLAGNIEVGVATTDPTMLAFEESPIFRSIYDTYSNTRGHLFSTWAIKPEVQGLQDLDGANIGVKDLSGGEIAGLRAMLRKVGFEEGENYTLITLGESTAVHAEALVSGRVDAFHVSVFNTPGLREILDEEDIDLRCITCDEDNVLTSQVVIARNDFVEQHPDLVVGLGRAFAKATLFGQTNVECALEVMSRINPEQTVDRDVALRRFEFTLGIVEPEPAPADRNNYGMQNMMGWQNAMEFLLDPDVAAGLSGPIDLEALVDTSFVDQFNDFDREEVIAQATACDI